MAEAIQLFVDREKQTAGFVKMLSGGTAKRIMLIEAPGGMGKSWTVEYMRTECVKRNVPSVEIDFGDNIIYDFLTVLRRTRDSFGTAAFNTFTQIINDATQPTLRLETSNATNTVIDLAQNATISSSSISVGDIAGGNIIKDNLFVMNTDSPVIRQALQDRLTTAFFECLSLLTAQGPVCFFFDTYDRVTVEAESWVMSHLLPRIREGKLTNVFVVIAGRRVPSLDALWNAVVARTGLDLLTLEHVGEYLIERCGLLGIEQNVVTALFQASTGQPQLLALLAENLRRSRTSAGDADDWL